MQYRLAYDGKHAFAIHPLTPADNFVVYTAKGIDFSAKSGAPFRATQEDPRVETHVVRGVHPGDEIAFTVAGQGQMPQDPSGQAMQMSGSGGMGKPGGGIGAPIASPDPLTGSKTWLLGGFAVLPGGVAFFVVRRRNSIMSATGNQTSSQRAPSLVELPEIPVQQARAPVSAPAAGQNVLIESLKEELFTLEQDKVSGKISASEYADAKTGLEAMLKRVLKTSS